VSRWNEIQRKTLTRKYTWEKKKQTITSVKPFLKRDKTVLLSIRWTRLRILQCKYRHCLPIDGWRGWLSVGCDHLRVHGIGMKWHKRKILHLWSSNSQILARRFFFLDDTAFSEMVLFNDEKKFKSCPLVQMFACWKKMRMASFFLFALLSAQVLFVSIFSD